MKKFRITYKKLGTDGLYQPIFTAMVVCKSMRGAKRKAKNLEPFEWESLSIIDLTDEWNKKLDQIEFNY